jgi:hypothetical protein
VTGHSSPRRAGSPWATIGRLFGPGGQRHGDAGITEAVNDASVRRTGACRLPGRRVPGKRVQGRDHGRIGRPRAARHRSRPDLVVIKRDLDGSYEAFEFDDADAGPLGEIRELEAELADLLSADDVTAVADALEPGSAAGLLVYENLWAAGFASAVRRAGGQLVASGRIPVQALIGAIEEELEGQDDRTAPADVKQGV